ncbi:MAG: ComEC/Rec2 family competence protein [Acidobacteriota bacterium]|nr:ComEC/Rec2 family competence protein [Acidobacteriota bacterium]
MPTQQEIPSYAVSHPDANHLSLRAGRIPLFHAAWLFALGIVLAHGLYLRPSWLLCALLLIALLWMLSVYRAERISWFPMAAMWLLLGAWCAQMEPQPAPAPQLAALSNGLLRELDGTIVNVDALRSNAITDELDDTPDAPTQVLDVELRDAEFVTDSVDRMQPVTGKVRLTVRWPVDAEERASAESFHCGDRVHASVQLLEPADYRDAGAFSRAGYLLDQDITATGSVKIARIARLNVADVRGAAGWHWLARERVLVGCRLHAAQQAVSHKLLALPAAMERLPSFLRITHEDAALLAAMTTGDRTFLTQPLRRGFERTGSFHMLVVSGLHIGIVAGCLLWFLRALRIKRVPATLLTIAGSVAYALFTGFATPVQRSLWMVILYLIGRLIYRQRNALNAIGFAALGMMAASPRVLLEPGFQMTLLAVLSIAGVGVPLLEKSIQPYLRSTKDIGLTAIDTKLEPRIAAFRVDLRFFAETCAQRFSARFGWKTFPWCVRTALRVVEVVVIACVVELTMSLPMALYFHRVTIFSLPVNVLILPLLSLLLPSALLTLAVLLIWPSAAVVPATVTATLLHAGVGIVRFFGSMVGSDLRVATPLAWQYAVFCLALAAAVALAHGGRTSKYGAVALLLGGGFVCVLPRPVAHPRNALLVEALDVGQGDSLLLITPDGKAMLVDGGGMGGGMPQAKQWFDVGEEVVSPALWARGIRHLDVVVLTHAHGDHMGGLPSVLKNFRPAELWVGENPPVRDYESLLDEARSLGVKVRRFHAGEEAELGDASVHVLAPAANYTPGPQPENDDSLVLRVAYEKTSALLAGDAESPEEHAMLNEADLQSTLLKVGHHGSVTSTTPAFLAAIHPQWAVISCGLHNRYGHPREEVLHALEESHVRTMSTDIDGATCFQLDGSTIRASALCGLDANGGDE